jgi:hypothetical protein
LPLILLKCGVFGKTPSLARGNRFGDHFGMSAGQVIHIGRIDFRCDDRVFGIKHNDRFSHLYNIGKTGTGKSTLIETMALQDLERGNGFALIDPHGDLVARIAARIPASQRDRVVHLNTTDPAQPYGYNPLRHVAEDRIALAASGMMDVFKKMWPDAWGVRMEHILRNVLIALLVNFTVQTGSWAAGQRLRLFFKSAARALAIRDAQVRVDGGAIRYALETDWLVGAAGFEPLHI